MRRRLRTKILSPAVSHCSSYPCICVNIRIQHAPRNRWIALQCPSFKISFIFQQFYVAATASIHVFFIPQLTVTHTRRYI